MLYMHESIAHSHFMKSSVLILICLQRISNEFSEKEEALLFDQVHDIHTRLFERADTCRSIDRLNHNRQNSMDAIHN
jgi:hypothetical protein